MQKTAATRVRDFGAPTLKMSDLDEVKNSNLQTTVKDLEKHVEKHVAAGYDCPSSSSYSSSIPRLTAGRA